MRKLASFGCMLLPLATLTGCTNISRLDVPPDAPSPDGKYRPSVESIVQRVRCELAPLADETRDINLTHGDWIAVVQLTLDVVDDGSLAPSFNYINGLFSFNVGAKYEVSKEHNVVIELIYPIKEIQSEIRIETIGQARGHLGAAGPSRFSCPDVVETNLAGEFSITQTADMAYKAENLNTTVAAAANTGIFGGYVQFIVTKNLNAVGPTWSLTHFKGPGSLGGISEVNTDKVVFAFAQAQAENGKKGKSNAVQAARTYITNININQLTVAFSGTRQNMQ